MVKTFVEKIDESANAIKIKQEKTNIDLTSEYSSAVGMQKATCGKHAMQ